MLLEQIEQLYEAQLYDDVHALCGIALTLADQNAEQLSMMARYQLLCYQADALYHSALYRQAEACYMNALQLRKGVVRGGRTTTKSQTSSSDVLSEEEVKFRLHQCYVQLKEYKEAIQTLKSINPRQRSCKVNLALARLYQRTGANDRSAVTAYKDVLRECPLSLVSLQALLSLGVRLGELETLLRGALPPPANISDWLAVWLRGQAQLAGKEYGAAAQTLRSLDARPLLRDNILLLSSLGEALYLSGDFPAALATLQRAHDIDGRSLLKMDMLAHLYYTEHRRSDLESLASALVLVADNYPEPWIAVGYLSCLDKKHTRAIYFAQKALCLDARSVQALLLKSCALLESKKEPEAIEHYREALRLAPHRYEPYSGLVSAYLALDRVREALATAAESCKQLYCARTLTLYGSVLGREPLSAEKAKDCLERALKLDPSHLDAVYALVGILTQQQLYSTAVKLVRGVLQRQVSSRLHRMLADLLLRTKDTLGATQHFELALNIDPRNTKACEGLARIEKHADLGPTDRTFDVGEDVMDSSDNEDQFRPSHQGRQVAAPQFELEASVSDDGGESEFNSDLAPFS